MIKNMKRYVIIGGAPIGDYERICGFFGQDDYFVFCDSGLYHLEKLGVKPNLIIGDYDSHEKPKGDCEIIVLPHEKDDTDTLFAAKEGIRRGYDSFLLTGTTGARIDHTLANLAALSLLYRAGKRALAVDDYTEMEIAGAEPVAIHPRYPYFSLLNITGKAKGVTVTGAKFPLTDAEIATDDPYGVSNEPLPDKTAYVSVREGELLLVKVVRDARG